MLKTNSKGEKLYPFSMKKHGHDLEFAYNHQWLICREMEDGDREWDDRAFERLETIEKAYLKYIGYEIVYVTGKNYGLLRDLCAWAENYRAERKFRREEN